MVGWYFRPNFWGDCCFFIQWTLLSLGKLDLFFSTLSENLSYRLPVISTKDGVMQVGFLCVNIAASNVRVGHHGEERTLMASSSHLCRWTRRVKSYDFRGFPSSSILGKQAKCPNLRFRILEMGIRLWVFLVIVLGELER